MEDVMDRVLSAMRLRLDESLTLDDLAKTAMLSKFHFARVFRRATGVSPLRFLYALRIQEAKRLLVATSLSVTDISYRVGYQSPGTFTSRFTGSVGVPPTVYRRFRGEVLPMFGGEPPNPAAQGMVTLQVEDAPRPTLVGLFPRSVPEGRPARCGVLDRSGTLSLDHVPVGTWYFLALSFSRSGDGIRRTMMNVRGPVRITPDAPAEHLTMRLRPMRAIDPPILVGLAHPMS